MEKIEEIITRLVRDSANSYLTGVCCINLDDKVDDKKVIAILRLVENLRTETIKTLI